MNKRQLKTIKSQAQYLKKIVNDIKSMKRGRKFLAGKKFFVYTRKNRHETYKRNGKHYMPTNIKSAIAGMSDYQLARLMRIVYTNDNVFINTAGNNCRQKYGRTYPIYGNFFDVKNALCEELFKKKDLATPMFSSNEK